MRPGQQQLRKSESNVEKYEMNKCNFPCLCCLICACGEPFLATFFLKQWHAERTVNGWFRRKSSEKWAQKVLVSKDMITCCQHL